jgi:hypothetical protein
MKNDVSLAQRSQDVDVTEKFKIAGSKLFRCACSYLRFQRSAASEAKNWIVTHTTEFLYRSNRKFWPFAFG